MKKDLSLIIFLGIVIAACSISTYVIWHIEAVDVYTGSPQIASQSTLSPYPDRTLTPGTYGTLSASDLTKTYNGQTYSQANRNVTGATKSKVCTEYVVGCAIKHEIDHFYPLCAGGSNDITNLWAEPEHVYIGADDWGFHTKDKLETYICSQIKLGKIKPQDAYEGIITDWIAYYKQVMPTSAKYGSVNAFYDGEDSVDN